MQLSPDSLSSLYNLGAISKQTVYESLGIMPEETYEERRDHLLALCAAEVAETEMPCLYVNKMLNGDGQLWYQVDEKYPCRNAKHHSELFKQIAPGTKVIFREWDLDHNNESCYSTKNHREVIFVVKDADSVDFIGIPSVVE